MPELVSREVPSVPNSKEDLEKWSENILRDHFEDLKILNDGHKETTIITDSPYTVLPGDEEIPVNTDSGNVTVLLPAIINGKKYRIMNVGSSGNKVILTPDGTDGINGVNESESIYDSEKFILTGFVDLGSWW